MCTRSFTSANNAKIVPSSDAQCNTEESSKVLTAYYFLNMSNCLNVCFGSRTKKKTPTYEAIRVVIVEGS